MPRCKSCGLSGLFLYLDSEGYCVDCSREIKRKNRFGKPKRIVKPIKSYTINVCQTLRTGNRIYEKLCVDSSLCKYYYKKNDRCITEDDFVSSANASYDFDKFTGIIQSVLEEGNEASDEYINPERSSEVYKMNGSMQIVFDDDSEEQISLFLTTKEGNGVFGIYVYWTRMCQAMYDMINR